MPASLPLNIERSAANSHGNVKELSENFTIWRVVTLFCVTRINYCCRTDLEIRMCTKLVTLVFRENCDLLYSPSGQVQFYYLFYHHRVGSPATTFGCRIYRQIFRLGCRSMGWMWPTIYEPSPAWTDVNHICRGDRLDAGGIAWVIADAGGIAGCRGHLWRNPIKTGTLRSRKESSHEKDRVEREIEGKERSIGERDRLLGLLIWNTLLNVDVAERRLRIVAGRLHSSACFVTWWA